MVIGSQKDTRPYKPEARENRHRCYQEAPEKKTLQDCRNHGSDHKAYRFYGGVDPRWSEEQKAAYWEGYNNYYDNYVESQEN